MLGAVGAAVTLAIVFPNTASEEKQPNASERAEPLPRAEALPKTVALAPAARAAALNTARDFIKTAVLRHRVGLSWPLTSRTLRAGYTRKEWSTGNIPVVPYPARSLASARWRLNHSYKDAVGLDVLLLPKPGSGVSPTTFEIDMRAVGTPRRKHWVVEAWFPRGLSAPSLTRSERVAAAAASSSHPLGAVWLLAPVGLLVVLLLVPFAVLLRGWRANRRAERAYREALRLPEQSNYSSTSSPS